MMTTSYNYCPPISSKSKHNSLASAASNSTAATVVGVCLGTWLAIVVRCSSARARDLVGPERVVAYVVQICQYASIDFRVHLKFNVAHHALCHGTVTVSLSFIQDPARAQGAGGKYRTERDS